MRSLLFRRETSRRIRQVAQEVADTYQERRYPWLNAYAPHIPWGTRDAVEALADSVADDDPMPYRAAVIQYVDAMLDAGMPPIAVLAAADLFHGSLLALLTPDQRALLDPLLEMARDIRADLVYRRVFESELSGA